MISSTFFLRPAKKSVNKKIYATILMDIALFYIINCYYLK